METTALVASANSGPVRTLGGDDIAAAYEGVVWRTWTKHRRGGKVFLSANIVAAFGAPCSEAGCLMDVVLLDFFGTLVDYSPSRVDQGYVRSHALLLGWGADLGYAAFLARWSDTSAEFDAASAIYEREFSMHELGHAFLTDVLQRPAADHEVDQLVTTYLSEWNTGVHPIDGVAPLLADLARHSRLAVVTNTHHPSLVPDHLAAMGMSEHIEAVITSVEVGWRKPHRAIYEAALEAMGVGASSTTFVGDTRSPDYDGPREAGMRALLIDPGNHYDIPHEDRLDSILDLPSALSRQA